jgi:hypothetical protein
MERDLTVINRRASNALRLCSKSESTLESLALELFVLDNHVLYIGTRASSPLKETEFGPPLGFDLYSSYLMTLTYLETARAQVAHQILTRGGKIEPRDLPFAKTELDTVSVRH